MTKKRNTRQRQLVLNAVYARKDHPSAEDIYKDVRAIDGRIGRSTVYRNLKILAQQGDILQVKLKDTDRFEGKADRHYHVQCSSCGELRDAPLAYKDGLDEKMVEKTGFQIRGHRMVFEGICPKCSKKIEEDLG